MKRKLTAEEKVTAREIKRDAEIKANPGANITVTVRDETDDDGNPIVDVVRITTKVMPDNWKP